MARKAAGSKVRRIDPKKLKKKIVVGTRTDWFKIEDGIPYEIRVLPPLEGHVDAWGKPLDVPWVEHMQHGKNRGGMLANWDIEGSQYQRQITCLEWLGEPKCPVCELQRWCEENDIDPEFTLFPKPQYLMNLIYEGALWVWGAPPTAAGKIQEITESPHYGVKIFDPVLGRDLELKRTKVGGASGKGGFRSYSITPLPKSSRIELKDWEGQATKLARLITPFSYQDAQLIVIQNLGAFFPMDEVFGVSPEKARPKPKPKKKVSKKGRK